MITANVASCSSLLLTMLIEFLASLKAQTEASPMAIVKSLVPVIDPLFCSYLTNWSKWSHIQEKRWASSSCLVATSMLLSIPAPRLKCPLLVVLSKEIWAMTPIVTQSVSEVLPTNMC